MKKLLIVALALLLVTMLFACKKDTNDKEGESITTESTTSLTVSTNEIIPEGEEGWGELIPID